MNEPVPADQLRVGDAERQQAVTALGEHYAAGRLDQEEYDTRAQAAYAARTRVDLRGLFGDLPAPAPFGTDLAPVPAGAGPGWAAGRAARDRPARRPGPPPPVFLVLLVAAIAASAALHAPVVPIFLLVWFLAGRHAWR